MKTDLMAQSIAIGEDHAGVLAAQLERDRPDPLGCGLHDGDTRACFASEGDCVDARVPRDQFASGTAAESMNDVVDTVWNARGVHDFPEQRRRTRRLLRWLDHDGITAGERRRDLPRHQQERCVPWADDSHYPARAPERIVHDGARLAVRDERFRRNILDQVGEHPEVRGSTGNEAMLHDCPRLPCVGHFSGDELVEAPGNLVRDLVQDFRTPLYG
jgi:hypothetical protein